MFEVNGVVKCTCFFPFGKIKKSSITDKEIFFTDRAAGGSIMLRVKFHSVE
jgi:hypothetical protein